MEINDQQISGLYLAYRRWELYWLENKKQDQKISMDYFKLEKLLHSKFKHDTCVKILENLNCDRKVALDFDNNVAKLIIEKEEPFENTMKQYFDPKYIQQTIDSNNTINNAYSKDKIDIRPL